MYRSLSLTTQTKSGKSTKKPKNGRKVSKLFRIVGGSSVSIDEMPWQAAIIIQRGVQIKCGGTLICPKYVMSAGHCSHDPTLKNVAWIEILLGEIKMI